MLLFGKHSCRGDRGDTTQQKDDERQESQRCVGLKKTVRTYLFVLRFIRAVWYSFRRVALLARCSPIGFRCVNFSQTYLDLRSWSDPTRLHLHGLHLHAHLKPCQSFSSASEDPTMPVSAIPERLLTSYKEGHFARHDAKCIKLVHQRHYLGKFQPAQTRSALL